MTQLRESGTTIVLVSDNALLMSELCIIVGWLGHGRLKQVGD